MRLLLVRHGETAWNTQRRLQGNSDVPLSDQGRAQCAALAPLVTRHRPERVVASPLGRTRETVARLGLTIDHADPRWQEADLGEWCGEGVDDLPPELYRGWRAGELTPPGGETFAALTERVRAGLTALPADRTVLVVTHGGPIRALLHDQLGLRPDRIVPVRPATLTVLERDDHGTRLHQYNIGS